VANPTAQISAATTDCMSFMRATLRQHSIVTATV